MGMEPQQPQKPEQREPNTVIKVIVLIALIALLVIGILLPIKLVPSAVTSLKGFFTSLFGTESKITLSLDKKTISSGDAFTLSWKGMTDTDGSYLLKYDCLDGVTFITSVNQPSEKIVCGAQYYFAPSQSKISVTASSSVLKNADVPVTVSLL